MRPNVSAVGGAASHDSDGGSDSSSEIATSGPGGDRGPFV